VVTVGYAVLLYVKYNRKKGSWSPKRYELAYTPHSQSSRSSFRVIREASPVSPNEVPAPLGVLLHQTFLPVQKGAVRLNLLKLNGMYDNYFH